MRARKIHLEILLVASLLCVAGCSESAPNSVLQPSPSPKAAEEPPVGATHSAIAPVAANDAPRAHATLTFLSSSDARASVSRPVNGQGLPNPSDGDGPDPAEFSLVDHDKANNIADRCSPSQREAHANGSRGAVTSLIRKMEQFEAKPIQVGLVPIQISPTIANQLVDKTRVWKIESEGFDFYRILSNARSGGLRPDVQSVGCIRYSMFWKNAKLYSDIIFSVIYDPRIPEVVKIAPVRLYYREFNALSAGPGTTEAAVKVQLSLRSFSLERTSGRLSNNVQNEEMIVEIVRDEGAGRAVYQLYDPIAGPKITLPLPPWDYSGTSVNPRHNLSILGITITEIADFDWLQTQVHNLWPSWEYEATDVYKIKLASQFYSHAHGPDAVVLP